MGRNLYVGNLGTPQTGGTIAVYGPGQTQPKYTITLPTNVSPVPLALDADGNLYAAKAWGGGVAVYAAGTSKLVRTLAAPYSESIAITP